MKKAFLFPLFFLFAFPANSQVIRGRVLDQKTREPIDFASVFFNGTFHGTSTAEDGSFVLDVTPYAGRTLQISAMGYNSSSLNSLIEGEFYEVFLERVLYEISEVSVESKSLAKKRKAYMRIFKNEFLGLTRNAGDCYIMNEKDITFNYHSSRDTLRALSRKPLIILNKSLGYQITYHLDIFEYDRTNKVTFFAGNIIFNMDLASGSDNKAKIEKRRMKTYTGSCKQFFTALWKNELSSEGFQVYEKESLQPVEYEEMVVSISAKKYFSYHRDLEISYNHFLSTVSFMGPGSYFAKDGFFEPGGILWYGTMSFDRIADWLPYEYSPK